MLRPRHVLRLVAACAIGAGIAGTNAAAESEFDAGAAEFRNSCASCHGADGKGAGYLTRLFRGVNPGDLTQLAKSNDGVFPLERTFQVIDGRAEVAAHGDRKMPVWGDRYTADALTQYGPDAVNELRARTRVLELVNYLQSIQER